MKLVSAAGGGEVEVIELETDQMYTAIVDQRTQKVASEAGSKEAAPQSLKRIKKYK